MICDLAVSYNGISFPPNVRSAESSNLKGSIYASVRTSPDQGDQRNGEYQLDAINDFASTRDLNVADYRIDIGCPRDRIGPKTRPGLWELIELATRTGYPIVAVEWRRFCGSPMKLARFKGVWFLSLAMLDTPPDRLNGYCRRLANRLDPSKRGGRPAIQPTSEDDRILRQLWGRYPDRLIARELGWTDHKRVRRVARRLGLVGA